jgi:hypothetical protein
LWKSVWSVLENLKIEFPYEPAILLLGAHPKEAKLAYYGDTCIPMSLVALFMIAKL